MEMFLALSYLGALACQDEIDRLAEIQVQIERLASDRIEEREGATHALLRCGAQALGPLKAAQKHVDSEVSSRARKAYGDILLHLPPEEFHRLPLEMFNVEQGNLHILSIYVRRVTGRPLVWAAELGLKNRPLRIQTDLPLRRHPEALFKMYQAILIAHGFVLVPVGDPDMEVYKVRPCPNKRAYLRPSTLWKPEDRLLTRVFKLKAVKPSTVGRKIVNLMAYPQSMMSFDEEGALIVTDYRENVNRVSEFIDLIDGTE